MNNDKNDDYKNEVAIEINSNHRNLSENEKSQEYTFNQIIDHVKKKNWRCYHIRWYRQKASDYPFKPDAAITKHFTKHSWEKVATRTINNKA